MSKDCAFTLLPTETCSHCTGAVEVVKEAWYDRGTEVKTIQERMEELNRTEESDLTIQLVHRRQTGLYNKVEAVYGERDDDV